MSEKQKCKLHLLVITLFAALTPTHHLAGPSLSPHIWRGHGARVTEGMWDPERRIFSSRALFSQSIFYSTHLPEKPPHYTHWVHRHTSTNFFLSSPLLCSLPSLNVPDSNRGISVRRQGLWSIFSVILSFQIKGQFVFKPTKSSDGPRQRANTMKCLSRSICVMAE